MPELPEVQAMVDRLSVWTKTAPDVLGVEVVRQNGRYLDEGHGYAQMLRGQRIKRVRRRGKYIVFDMTMGKLVSHNAMSGYWDVSDEPWTFDYVEGKRTSNERDVRVRIQLMKVSGDHEAMELSKRVLQFHDSRLFGSLNFHETQWDNEIPALRELGPDALNLEGFQFLRILTTRAPIKEALMDQRKVAGIGNIYASEILFRSGIRPDKTAVEVCEPQSRLLFKEIGRTLADAVERNLDYSALQIYRRKTCPSCTGPVTNLKIKGRSSYFCERCQS